MKLLPEIPSALPHGRLYSGRGTLWHLADDDYLIKALAGAPRLGRMKLYRRIAEHLGRSYGSVQMRVYQLDLAPKNMRPTRKQWHAAAREAADALEVPFEMVIATSAVPGSRRRHIGRARWLAFTLLYEQGFSQPAIALAAGCDNSSVTHGLQRWRALREDQTRSDGDLSGR